MTGPTPLWNHGTRQDYKGADLARGRGSATAHLSVWSTSYEAGIDLSLTDLVRLGKTIDGLLAEHVDLILATGRRSDAARISLITPALQKVDSTKYAWWRTWRNGADAALEAAYDEASAELWALLEIADDEPLPVMTWRTVSGRLRTGSQVMITLTHEGGDLWTYQRADGEDPYFGPATLAELRINLADETWKP